MKISSRQFFFAGIFLFVLASFLNAQSPTVNWITHCGSNSGSDKTLDVSLDQAGNIYACGYFNDEGYFDTIHLTAFNKQAFVTKLDANGNFVWAISGGSGLDDRALGLCTDPQGNIIATGTYWSNATFGSFNIGGSADHVFVVKIDPNGNFLWATPGGSSGDDHGYDVVTDAQGNIFVTGYLSNHYGPSPGTSSFPNLAPFTVLDSIAFVGRMSPSGVWQWVKTFGGTDVERDNDIALDSLGNIYVVGGFYGTKTFGPVSLTSSNNSRDIFVVKYDANGNFIWVTTAGDTLDDRANGIAIDHEQHIYITGEFRDHVLFGSDTLNNYGGPSGRDIFVARMDLNGNWVWAKRAGSTGGSDAGRAITVNRDGNIFVTGQCKGLVKFGNDTTFQTGADSIQVFVAAIDSLGDWKWAMQGGSPLEDRGYGIEADTTCKLYFCGYYDMPSMQFGPHTDTSYGRKDGFIGRIDGGCFTYSIPDAIEDAVADECSPVFQGAFSPNGSGCISALDAWCVESMQCVFYNCWGQAVYQTKDPEFCWAATDVNGNALATGVYFYVYEGTLESGKKITRRGKIAVMR